MHRGFFMSGGTLTRDLWFHHRGFYGTSWVGGGVVKPRLRLIRVWELINLID